MQQWQYCTVEWLWDEKSIRVNMPDGIENHHSGTYAEVVATLTRLGSTGWEVSSCVAAGNWLFWTLKRPATEESLRQKIELALSDELAHRLEEHAQQERSSLSDFLTRAVTRHASALMMDTPSAWMPREQWDALVRGEDCPLCAELESQEALDAHGYTIADLSMSRLRLAANQSIPGYCVLICKTHVREWYQLSSGDSRSYFEDMRQAALALEQVFSPVKMNFEILGNSIPHLHCHIKPRFYGDPAPGMPWNGDFSPLRLTAEEYEERVLLIREALDAM
jgi:diadenosine tetraphosphate (Ap4A) HIT family hydrolase